jgi:hypothetical protein
MKIKELFENTINIKISDDDLVNGKLAKQYPNIIGEFNCAFTGLTSLEGCPDDVGGNFFASSINITSLEGAPTIVGGHFGCSNTKIKSLKGAPKKIGSHFSCANCQITLLEGIGKDYLQEIKGNLYLDGCRQLSSHMLGIMNIKTLKKIFFDVNEQVQNIFNKHLSGDRDIFACQSELIEAGFKDYAKL